MDAAVTFGALEAQLISDFAQHDIPAREASLLLQEAAGLDRAMLIGRSDEFVAPDIFGVVGLYRDRRIAGEPLYRIFGHREFHGLKLLLSDATLEPRDDTEVLIDAVLELLGGRRNEVLHFADLGTGTGAIALALLSELPNAHCLATDISKDALSMAKKNARHHGLSERLSIGHGSWYEAMTGRCDFIVSNPPYIASDIVDGLDTNVRDFDPRAALDGGADGLDAYRIILSEAADYLTDDGFLAVEIGFDQAASVSILANDSGWRVVALHQDLQGQDRALVFERA